MHKGYDYSRTANPTRSALEECLASLEGAAHGLAFSSGMGAITTVLHLLSPGRPRRLGERRLRRHVPDLHEGLRAEGLPFELVPVETMNAGLAERARRAYADGLGRVADEPAARTIVDIRGSRRGGARGGRPLRRRQHLRDAVPAAAARAGRRHRRPLDDEVPGRPLGRHRRLRRDERRLRSPSGSPSSRTPSAPCRARSTPGSSCAGSRRWRCGCASTARTRAPIAAWLDEHPAVERVRYPGLPEHPQHELAARQMDDFGGMVSFELAGSEADARAVVRGDADLAGSARASAVSRASSSSRA